MPIIKNITIYAAPKRLLAKDIRELAKYNYIKDAGVKTAADAEAHRKKLAEEKKKEERKTELNENVRGGDSVRRTVR